MRRRKWQPLVGDLRALLHEYQTRAARSATTSRSCGMPTPCAALLHDELAGDEVLVVSNREPYIHMKTRRRASRCSVRPAAW